MILPTPADLIGKAQPPVGGTGVSKPKNPFFKVGKHFRIDLTKVYAYEKQDVIAGDDKAYGFSFYLINLPALDVTCKSKDEYIICCNELDEYFFGK